MFLRASTRSPRTGEMLLLGQKIRTPAPLILPKFLSVVPFALLEAVIRTITAPLLVAPRVEIATKQGKSRSVTLPNVYAGLRYSLRTPPPLLTPMARVTVGEENPLVVQVFEM